MDLANSTFLITGAASGLGAACARRFSAAGAKVVLADLNDTAGAALVAELGKDARYVHVDVTSPEEAGAAVTLAEREFGALHGLVSCAGILGGARVIGREGPHDLVAFSRVIQVNLIGTFNVLRLAAAAMAKNNPNAAGERGVIINTSSVAAFEGQIGQAAYSASKGGVASLTLPLARDLARHGIRVVAIAPGVFATNMVGNLTPELQESLAAQVPFPPRRGEPDEFAQLAQQIVENTMLNGCVIRLDGALRMGPK